MTERERIIKLQAQLNAANARLDKAREALTRIYNEAPRCGGYFAAEVAEVGLLQSTQPPE